MQPENLLPIDGEAFYWPALFPAGLADEYFDLLVQTLAWSQKPIQIFGRTVLQPRLTAWCADPGVEIRYSGTNYQPQPWCEILLNIKKAVEQVAKHSFNGVLLNYYRDGQDSMGWHRDNEAYLGPDPVIASVSFGVERTFRLKHRQSKAPPQSLVLSHGSLLIMRGCSQTHWLHSVPKRQRVHSARLNLTFRHIFQ
jgi:alkylated DNA repair dioxygenase AlkB